MRFVKPLDEDLLETICKKYDAIITVEDNVLKGGFGTAILEFIADNNFKIDIKNLGVPDTFIEHGAVTELQQSIGLDADSLANYFNTLLQ